MLPARGTSDKDDSLFGHRDFSGIQDRIDASYEASVDYLESTCDPGRTVIWALRRLVVAPAVMVLTILVWVTFPFWLIGAAALSPILPGRLRALRLLWVAILYLTCETVLLVVLFGLWLASGFGWRIRTPYFEGIHYDLVQGVMWVFFREAKRVLNLTIETDGPEPRRPSRHADPGLLPSRRARRLLHADPRAHALVPARAPRRAQGHPRLGPHDRRRPQPDPGPVHHAEPPGRRRTSSRRSPRWPPASTRTTPS